MTLKVQIPNKSDQQIHILYRNLKSKESYFWIASFSSKKSNDKVGFEHFSLQKSPYCSPSIVTRTRLCCYITFQCGIARDWKAMFKIWLRREGRVCGIIFFTVVSKLPKGKCSTFWHFNSITRLAKRVIFSAQDNFQESHLTGMTFAR